VQARDTEHCVESDSRVAMSAKEVVKRQLKGTTTNRLDNIVMCARCGIGDSELRQSINQLIDHFKNPINYSAGTGFHPAPLATNPCTSDNSERAELELCKCNALGIRISTKARAVGLKPL